MRLAIEYRIPPSEVGQRFSNRDIVTLLAYERILARQAEDQDLDDSVIRNAGTMRERQR